MPELAILVVTIILALGYAYSNGMNDAANAVATSISTKALKPMTAVMLAGLLNTAGAFTGSAVAKTIGKGVIAPELMTQPAVMAAIATAIIWVVFATRAGYPVSVSHALIAGVVGAGVAVSGIDGLNMTIVIKVLLALALSPLLGFTAGFIVMLSIYWLFRRRSLSSVNAAGRRLQILSTAFLSFSHGRNDGQNAIGIIALAWAVYSLATKDGAQELSVEFWMILISALAIGLGTAIGGWGVIRTLGMRVTRLEPIHGFAADVSAASIIEAASNFGLPVSTTHTTTSSIMGVGATRRLSAVRWGVTRSILLAWLVTYPFCLVLAWVLAKALDAVL